MPTTTKPPFNPAQRAAIAAFRQAGSIARDMARDMDRGQLPRTSAPAALRVLADALQQASRHYDEADA